MEEARIDMFRDVVIKVANTYPNKPLSETQNNIIRDRFNRLFSAQHTPDHPPYAWMIERAIRELNEEGGSTEESISNFIRKEYDDLPWSHFTLLNHHLQELCKCGNIVLTHCQHYLLAGADSNLKLRTKCRRKQKRRKRDWDWHIKRRKLRKKDIGGESLLQEKDVHEKQNCIIEELKQQNIEAEARKDTLELCIVGEDGEQMEGDQTEISVPERPPGFDIETLEESSHLPLCCTENPSQGTHPMRRPPEVVLSVAEGLSGHQEQIHVFNVYDQRNCEGEQMLSGIGGESLLQEKDVHEKQNCIIEELKQQNIEAEARKDTLELCIVGEDGEQMEGDQTEISEPERPPGFDIETLEESSLLPLCCTKNPSQGTHPMRRPPEVLSVAEGLSGHQEQIHVFNVYDQRNCEEEQMLSGIGGESMLQEKDVHEKQNCIIEELKQQNIEAEARKDTLELCIVGEDGEQMEGDQTEISVPERPPGFDIETLEESSFLPLCYTENPSQGTHPMRRPPEVLSVAEGLSGHQEQIHVFKVYDQRNCEEEQMISGIGGESLLQEKDVHEKQNCIIEELKQQNIEAEARKDTLELCIVGEDGEQMEGDQTEISVPERPPGFDIETLEEPSHLPLCCTENPSQGTHPMRRPPEAVLSVAEGLSEHQEQIHVFNVYDQQNCKEQQMILSKHETQVASFNKTLEDVQPMTRNNGIDLQQTKNKEDPAMPSLEGSIELCSQKKPLESELTENTAAISESEPVNSAGGKQARRIVFTYRKRPPIIRAAKQKDVSHTIQERKEELLQEGQVKCQGQKHLLDNNATASSLQEHGLSNPKEQQKMKSGEANRSEHVPPCEGQQHPQGITEILDGSSSASSLLQHQLEEHQISDTKELQEGKSGTANRSKHPELLIPAAKPSCEENLQSEALNGVPEGPAISSNLPTCSKQPSGGDAHEFSLVPIPRPFKLETMDIEEALPTARAQRQRNRWRKRLSNVNRPQLEDQTLVESSQVTGDQVNLSSPGKRNAGQQRGVLALSVDLKEADCQELSRLAKLGKHPEVETQTQTPKHQPNRPVSQEKPLRRVLRPRPLKPGRMKVVTTADFSLPKNQHDVQKQHKYNLRRRPPKAKPHNRSKNDKVVSSPKPHLRQQSGNPKCKLREQ